MLSGVGICGQSESLLSSGSQSWGRVPPNPQASPSSSWGGDREHVERNMAPSHHPPLAKASVWGGWVVEAGVQGGGRGQGRGAGGQLSSVLADPCLSLFLLSGQYSPGRRFLTVTVSCSWRLGVEVLGLGRS